LGAGTALKLVVRYLLDTTVLIAASRHQEPAQSWLQAALRQDAEIGVSAVTAAEFFAGLRTDERPR
jgi:predicted nucleic acid-binding protein